MTLSRPVFAALGLVFFGLGFIGMFVPVLPTVPFWLLAAACFMRGSRRLYKWLMTHPKYGEYIYQYREAKAISTRTKIIAITMMLIGMIISIWIVPLVAVKIGLAVVLVCVTIYLVRMDTLTDGDLEAARATYADFVATEFGSDAVRD
ncbi:YbaN family protein [Trueperella bialowiezensis]|uniref:Inner membrane protein ybaN n=1 Tax=Trueperella bialowiezensis TaxID=312285 RepID=A0A3S4V7M6_9ACTO|nr:YbaN family protein [Trueperella bialowiezensis]VEI13814.1 Inner membrane protein ybaN [Trueperella bialowiezensis]